MGDCTGDAVYIIVQPGDVGDNTPGRDQCHRGRGGALQFKAQIDVGDFGDGGLAFPVVGQKSVQRGGGGQGSFLRCAFGIGVGQMGPGDGQ